MASQTTPVDPKTIQAELFGPTIKQYQTLLAISWHFATNGTEQFPSNYNSLVDVGDWTHDKLRRILSNYLRFVQQMELKAREFCKEENDESHHCVSTCAKPGPWRTEIFCAWAAIRSIDLKGPDGSFDEGECGQLRSFQRKRQNLEGWMQEENEMSKLFRRLWAA